MHSIFFSSKLCTLRCLLMGNLTKFFSQPVSKSVFEREKNRLNWPKWLLSIYPTVQYQFGRFSVVRPPPVRVTAFSLSKFLRLKNDFKSPKICYKALAAKFMSFYDRKFFYYFTIIHWIIAFVSFITVFKSFLFVFFIIFVKMLSFWVACQIFCLVLRHIFSSEKFVRLMWFHFVLD